MSEANQKLSQQARKALRIAAGLDPRNTRPVIVVDGKRAPQLRGRSYHWTNRSGDDVRYPSAYSRVGWSSLVYHPSTLRVVVGREWLKALARIDGREPFEL